MITWPAKVLMHVGEHAIVQVPGGMLPVHDAQGRLADGDMTKVHVVAQLSEATLMDGHLYWLAADGSQQRGMYVDAFHTTQSGQAAMLESPVMLVPLVGLQETLPHEILLAVDTQPAETDEGTPEGTGLPPDDSGPGPCGCIPDPCTPNRYGE